MKKSKFQESLEAMQKAMSTPFVEPLSVPEELVIDFVDWRDKNCNRHHGIWILTSTNERFSDLKELYKVYKREKMTMDKILSNDRSNGFLDVTLHPHELDLFISDHQGRRVSAMYGTTGVSIVLDNGGIEQLKALPDLKSVEVTSYYHL